MSEEDQKVRNEKPFNSEKIQKVDDKNRKKIKNIIDQYGLITISDFGKEASYKTWLLIQHFPKEEIEFMKKYLSLMLKDTNNINKKNLVYLEDRISMFSDKPQKYGTQTTLDKESKSLVFHKLLNVKKVDKYRGEFGLKPLKDYITDLQELSEYPIKLPEGY